MNKKKLKILAVIPARGGSKGVPRKNLYNLKDKPLIYYSIKSAIESKLITRHVVSTDDLEIKRVSESYGANVPFIRPKKLSTDNALAIPTIQHAVRYCEKKYDEKYDYIIMLQPTAPLRNSCDIDTALAQLIAHKDAESIISVVDVDNFHPAKMKIISDNFLIDFQKSNIENPPRQSLMPVFIVNGAIYATKRNVFMNDNTFKGDFCIPFIMPREKSVNIDNFEDFLVAEFMIEKHDIII